MSDSVAGGIQGAISDTAQRVAGGVQQAADQVQSVVGQAQTSVSEARHMIRGQPLVAAFVIFAVGYFIGRLDRAAWRRP